MERRPGSVDGMTTSWLSAGTASETQELCTKKTGSCAGTDFAQQPDAMIAAQQRFLEHAVGAGTYTGAQRNELAEATVF